MAGCEENYHWLKPLLACAKGELLLEVGAGTGDIARVLDPVMRYLWLDKVQKLSAFNNKSKGNLPMLADGTGTHSQIEASTRF